MTARAGMVNLIKQLRALCNAGQTDYTVDSVAYFSDDQLQAELDALVMVFRWEHLDWLPQRSGSAYIYKEFTVPSHIPLWLEEEGGGTGGWAVRDTSGNAKTISTDYSVNYRSGVLTFVADQVAAPNFWLDCRAYDMYRAAAAVWRQKAGLESRSVDWSNADHSFRASQRRDYCVQQAELFEGKAGMKSIQLFRSDEV